MSPLKLLFFLPATLFAIVNGNPGDPFLTDAGIIRKRSSGWSFRAGYMGDYVYKQKFRDEFQIAGCSPNTTQVKLYTNAGLITLNLQNRFDLYTLLGSSRIQIDQEVFSRTQFAWGIGGKALIFRAGRFGIGADLKYFESNQDPLFFVCDAQAYNITSRYRLNYTEVQGSAGVTYRTNYVAPYINVSYIHSKISPHPSIAVVRLPSVDYAVEISSKSVINLNRWGLALGATLIDKRKATLSFEWRAINQNSIDISGELRF